MKILEWDYPEKIVLEDDQGKVHTLKNLSLIDADFPSVDAKEFTLMFDFGAYSS